MICMDVSVCVQPKPKVEQPGSSLLKDFHPFLYALQQIPRVLCKHLYLGCYGHFALKKTWPLGSHGMYI